MFITRLVTVAVLLPLFVGALLFLPNKYWAVFLLPGILIASWEWAAMSGYRRVGRWLFGGVVLLSCVVLLYFSDHPASLAGVISTPPEALAYWVSTVFWLLLAPAWLAGKWRIDEALIMGVTGWVVLVPAWLALAALQVEPAWLLTLLGIVWIADSAAYLVGRRFGRRQLAPQISPGKTWEGVAGACAAVAVYYAVLWILFASRQPLLHGLGGVILFAVVTIMSVEGDLFESWIKRQAGIKDSGRLLPGHGGMLDRIDGLTASMPFAALSWYYCGAPGPA